MFRSRKRFIIGGVQFDGLITIAGLSGIGGSSGLPFNLTPDTYTEADGVNNSRLTSIVYPSGYTVYYTYGAGDSLDDKISRLMALKDHSGTDGTTVTLNWVP